MIRRVALLIASTHFASIMHLLEMKLASPQRKAVSYPVRSAKHSCLSQDNSTFTFGLWYENGEVCLLEPAVLQKRVNHD